MRACPTIPTNVRLRSPRGIPSTPSAILSFRICAGRRVLKRAHRALQLNVCRPQNNTDGGSTDRAGSGEFAPQTIFTSAIEGDTHNVVTLASVEQLVSRGGRSAESKRDPSIVNAHSESRSTAWAVRVHVDLDRDLLTIAI